MKFTIIFYRLFRALFQYIPLRDSPNDNPHLELALQAGDYVLVHGQMDEDQFYFGETLSGRTGLVPSNYVERIPDNVLLQNASRAPSPHCSTSVQTAECLDGALPSTSGIDLHAGYAYRSNPSSRPPSRPTSRQSSRPGSPRILFGNSIVDDSNGYVRHNVESSSRPASPSFTLNLPPHLSQITHDFTDPGDTPLPDSICPYPPVDVSKVTVQELKNADKPKGNYLNSLLLLSLILFR